MKMGQKYMYRDHIIFVAGSICSGKTYEARLLAEDLEYDLVEISNIVRGILDTNKRDKLQGHPEISTQIINQLAEIRRTTKKKGVVISGPRQVEIVSAFPEAELIWMNTSLELCFERFCSRGDSKDVEFDRNTFEEYLLKDDELGLQEVKQYMEKKKYEKN